MQFMRHRIIGVTVGFMVALFAPVVISVMPVYAHNGEDDTTEHTISVTESEQENETEHLNSTETTHQNRNRGSAKLSEVQQSQTEAHKLGQVKLEAAKLKVCKKREKVINNIMARDAERGTKRIALFTTIAERTEAFYKEKGRTAATYDALVAEVAAKKAAAEGAVAKTKEAQVAFRCDGTDPKGAATGFKDALKAQHAAVKAYKTAVKNLIVAVKSAQGTSSSTSATEGDQ